MKYLGSKRRLVNEILPIMFPYLKLGMSFVDAFCGGCSIIQHVPKSVNRIANDNNRYLIAMWKQLTNTTWQPIQTIPRELYDDVKKTWRNDDGRYDDATIGWVGFMASRLGRFFDSGYSSHSCNGRDYIAESIRNISRQIDDLRGVQWQTGSYYSIKIPPQSLIYCDPPYRGTTTYTTSHNFDYTHFYDWVRKMKQDGHTVFVSEYSMPSDFTCVWSKTITNSVSTKKTYQVTERLFTLL